MSAEKMREEFEAWWISDQADRDEDDMAEEREGDGYRYYTGWLWDAWQASRAAIEVDLEPDEPADEDAAYLHQDFVKERIESLGLKVRP